MENLMTIKQVAGYLSVSTDTVYAMAQSGEIPASKVGVQWRFRRKDVDAWLKKNSNVSSSRKKKNAGKRRKGRKKGSKRAS